MPVVCINRPNRKNPRTWHARDICRVARVASKVDGYAPTLRCALEGSGLAQRVCNASSLISAVVSVIEFVKIIVGFLASLKAIEVILTILKRDKLIKIPYIGWIVLTIIALLLIIDAFQKDLKAVAAGASEIIFLLELIVDICDEEVL